MKRMISRLLIISMLVSPLAACGGKKKKKTPPVTVAPAPPPASGARFEDQFGSAFGNIFRAAASSEPVDPKPGDLVAISLDRDPVDF